jgi:hypothetical protein
LQECWDAINAYLSKFNGSQNNFTFLISYDEVFFEGLLDDYPGAAAAYSLRKLDKNYSGDAIRVRRASNNDEQDIGFDSYGDLDTAALATFCSGTDGFVKVWYDQSGNGNDATQTTTGNQPKIVASGSIIEEGGKPCIRRASSSSNMTFAVAGNSTQHIFGVVNISADKSIMTSDVSNTSKYYLVAENGNATSPYGNTTASDFYLNGTLSNATVASRNAVHDALINTQRLFSQMINNNTWGSNQYFGYASASVYGMMDLQEVILYNFDQSANRTAIEDNINDYYSIY